MKGKAMTREKIKRACARVVETMEDMLPGLIVGILLLLLIPALSYGW